MSSHSYVEEEEEEEGILGRNSTNKMGIEKYT